MNNKDKEFWKELGKWEVVILLETWLDGKGWERVMGRLPRRYEWGAKWGKRISTKGRVMGGMVMGIRKGMRMTGQSKGRKGELGDKRGICK